MSTGRRIWAYAVAAVGSAGLIVSLWLPWYSFRIPGFAIDQAEQVGQQFGILAPLIRQGAEIARGLGALHLTAWDVLHQADIIIALAAGAAGALALLASTGRATGVGRVIAAAGAVALGVALYRTLVPPGPNGFLHAAWGSYVALAAGAAALAGGLLASGEDKRPSSKPPPRLTVDQPPAWPATDSVAPPGMP
jgi:hypothetical protein